MWTILACLVLVMYAFPWSLFGNEDSNNVGLQWEQNIVKITVLPPTSENESVSAEFRFTNTDLTETKIVSVKTSCGCTVANLKKWNYAPNESGKVEVAFKLKSPKVLNSAEIAVETNKGSEQLKIQITVKERLLSSQSILSWNRNAERRWEEINVDAEIGSEVIRVQQSETNFELVDKSEPNTTRFRFLIRPMTTDLALRSLIAFKVRFPDGWEETIAIVAKVQ